MADTNRAPRRVSMAYILGFSNKPFKDGGSPVPAQPPPPRHPSAFKKMVSTPGGVLEWAASDGRRGRLTGPGKPRLSTTDPVPTADTGDDGDLGMSGLFDGPSAKAASVKAAQDDDAKGNSWTKEEDAKLMELKGANKPWADIAEETGKKEQECRARFKQIKPKDWKPDGGKSGSQKQGKQKGQKQNGNQNNQKDGGDKDGKKDENANGGFDASADNPWGGGGWGDNNNNEATQNDGSWDNNGGTDAWGGNNNAGDTKAEDGFKESGNGWGNGGDTDNANTGNTWGNTAGGGGTSGGWDDTGGDANNNTSWDNENTPNNKSDSNNNGNNPWDGNNDSWDSNNNSTPNDKASQKNSSNKPPSNRSSGKPSSHSDSKQHSSSKSDKPSKSTPSEYELKPDSTFSADDLRLIARVLQQDCQLVWNRVSWRFKDKTGRNLHPEVFEKKITGEIENKGSERGGR